MPSVLFWAGVGGGTAQYRCRIPGASLERLGWDVHYVTEEIPDAADVVVLQRVLHPNTVTLIRELQAHGSKVVYDIDDWYDGLPAYNPASRTVDTETLDTLHAVLAAADLITTSTPELAESYSRFGETAVLPNYLDHNLWHDAEKYRSDRNGMIHVGWLGSAKWRSADVELLKPWLADWLATRPEVRLVAAGSDRSLFEYLGVGGLICPPSQDHIRPYQHLPAMLGWFDIGLVPLARNKFNDCKSWAKGLEYNAAGVAAIASPSREYRTFIRPGINGYLVSKKKWRDALELALDELPGLRAGALKVANEFWIDDHVDKWVSAYG